MEKHTVSHVLVLYFLLTKIMITRVESVVWLARIYLINLLEWKAHFSKIIPILQKHFYWCRFSEGCWSSGMQQGTLSNGEFIYLLFGIFSWATHYNFKISFCRGKLCLDPIVNVLYNMQL